MDYECPMYDTAIAWKDFWKTFVIGLNGQGFLQKVTKEIILEVPDVVWDDQLMVILDGV